MSNFSIRIEGLDELTNALGKVDTTIKKEMYKGMVASTTLVQNEARAVRPGRFKNQTGNLRRSILKGKVRWDYGEVGTNEKYAAPVEFGTRPHTIYPKNRRFLAFKSKSGGMIFARKVNHPGSKPYPFMRPAFERNQGKITNIFGSVGLRIVQSLAD